MENNNLWCWCCETRETESQRQDHTDGVEHIANSIIDYEFDRFIDKMMKKVKQTSDLRYFALLSAYGASWAFGIWFLIKTGIDWLS